MRAFIKFLDQKDFMNMLRMVDANVEGCDEITKKWIRGKKAFEAYVKRVGPEVSDIKSRIHNVRSRRVGSAGLATFNMKQSYTLSGKGHNLNFVANTVLVKRGTQWKIGLIHMTPVGGA